MRYSFSRSNLYLILGLLVQSLCVLAQETSGDPDAPLKYIPNKIIAAVTGSIYCSRQNTYNAAQAPRDRKFGNFLTPECANCVTIWGYNNDHPEITLDAWRRATFDDWNLSYDFLTSAYSQETVRERFAEDQESALSIVNSSIRYVATAVGFLIWSVWYRGYYTVTIIAGTVGYALGLFLRIRYAQDPTSAPTFNAMDLFLLVSPCGFIAGMVMVLTPLATYLDAIEFLVINPGLMTKGFLFHEFVAFLVQGTGSAMSISTNVDIKSLGAKILIGGLVLQTISLTAFTTIYAIFVFRLRKHRKEEWSNRPNGILKHWLALVMILGVGLQNLSIRGGYRMLVAMQGPNGFLSSTEQYFYTAECVTLWGAISSFLVVWPPKYLAMPRPVHKKDPEVASVASFYSGPRS